MFGLSFDEMESELRVVPIITKVVGLTDRPSYYSIHRASEKLTEEYIKLVNERLVKEYENKNKIYVGEREIYPEHYKECGGSIVASLIKSYHGTNNYGNL